MEPSRREQIRRILETSYRLTETRIQAGDGDILLTGIEDIEELINRITPEEFAVDERLPYWAVPWRSAVALCRYITGHPEEITGREILEIGCGLGLAGIAAVRMRGSVLFTDYEPDALQFAEYNLLRNVPPEDAPRASFALLDWRIPPPRQWDVLLAADILYEERSVEPLLAFVDQALRPGGILLVSEPDRLVAEPFFRRLREFRWRMRRHTMEILLDGASAEISIHRVERVGSSEGGNREGTAGYP